MHTALLSLRLECNNNSGIYFHKPTSGHASQVTSYRGPFSCVGKSVQGLELPACIIYKSLAANLGNLPQILDVSETNSDSSCEH